MGFDALLGNEQLKENLTAACRRHQMSHFYLISGPAGSGRHTLADLMAQALLCEQPDAPCGHCRACRKVQSHTHPDYILADEPDTATVRVDFVRQIRSDVFIRPNEGVKKIYLFPRAQDMRLEAQNALLKVLEEPPAYGVFLLLTDNPDKLLPTIRSRCVELKLRPLPEALLHRTLAREFPDTDPRVLEAAAVRSGGYLGQAKTLLSGSVISPQTAQFAKAYTGRSTLALLELLVPMEKWKRDALIPVLEEWAGLVQQAMVHRSGLPTAIPEAADMAASRNMQELMHAASCLRRASDYAAGNVSCAAVCSWLSWMLR